jgi:cytochrome oxidase Cu insertion factor (SCO1/SenC/PrrC family)
MRTIALCALILLLLAVILIVVPAQAAPRPAPAFALELFNGQTLRLVDLKGTAIIILFWTQW